MIRVGNCMNTDASSRQSLDSRGHYTRIALILLSFEFSQRHNANNSLDSTMTAHASSNALDSLSSSTLKKLHEAAQPPSKKRKIGLDSAANQLTTDSIIIRVRD